MGCKLLDFGFMQRVPESYASYGVENLEKLARHEACESIGGLSLPYDNESRFVRRGGGEGAILAA